MKIDELLLELSNLDALPGQEQYVQRYLKESIHKESSQDAFGNLYFGDLQTSKKKVAIYAHMDEVGFCVQRMTEDGFVYFYPIGGWWGHVILGQQVRVTCRKNGSVLEGVVGTLPKGSKMDKEVVPINEMYIDFGASSKSELEAAGLQIGDMILPNTKANRNFNGTKIIGKALDNRVACAVMTELLNHVTTDKIEVIGVATVQEEAGTRGSKIAAREVDADINIVIDVANGKDTPKAADYQTRILGEGTGLVVADKTALANLNLLDFVKDIAEKERVAYQYDMFNGGGTDAGSVQLYKGKPTIVLSVPVRYCHSWNSVVDISDVVGTAQLMKKVIQALNDGREIIDQF
ncbi:M42 family metallopeptidase [Enterococcus ureasiticus]|uniref:Peptidase M42 n=1 Tax=Enterococcus ureasiticus TaxID=903984 RepID=A0A1E5GA69_9ENTE|nr:M20/M25/M40 family metallo-hydrolase [Enterococcus ureasiticus]OEG09557.1 peptidase M42 [Enterococcus ureasiticus]